MPILTALAAVENQVNLFLSTRLHLPAILGYFHFICTFPKSHNTIFVCSGKSFIWIIKPSGNQFTHKSAPIPGDPKKKVTRQNLL